MAPLPYYIGKYGLLSPVHKLPRLAFFFLFFLRRVFHHRFLVRWAIRNTILPSWVWVNNSTREHHKITLSNIAIEIGVHFFVGSGNRSCGKEACYHWANGVFYPWNALSYVLAFLQYEWKRFSYVYNSFMKSPHLHFFLVPVRVVRNPWSNCYWTMGLMAGYIRSLDILHCTLQPSKVTDTLIDIALSNFLHLAGWNATALLNESC